MRNYLPLILLCLSPTMLAQEASDPAWRTFQHELGVPAPIGESADHALATSITRPFPAVELAQVNPRKYLLGSDLYQERALSVDNTMACFICHAGPLSGTDGRTVARGVAQAVGKVNTLTVLNAAFNFRQFWNGRAITLADQALLPITTPHEMANTLEQVLVTLQADAWYEKEFNAVYPDGITTQNLADAIAHFERTSFAVTNTRFQHFLQGDKTALNEQEQRGWQRFQDIGCSSCHNGIGLGGNSYQKLGSWTPWFPTKRQATLNDAGLAERTNREQDLYVVKVPSLHNVAMTEPYLHDGSLDNLQSVTAEMARFQLGRELSDEEISDIVAFLVALNGAPEGLTLEREIRKRAAQPSCAEELSPECGPPTTEITHDVAYRNAKDAIIPALARLLEALTLVDSGAVAHFDFVQFEHLELIRHARALQHPPASQSAQRRQCLQNGASRLLQEVILLELPIADYLQAKAMLGVLESHRQSPSPSTLTAENLTQKIVSLEGAAQQSMQTIHATLIGNATERLEQCP